MSSTKKIYSGQKRSRNIVQDGEIHAELTTCNGRALPASLLEKWMKSECELIKKNGGPSHASTQQNLPCILYNSATGKNPREYMAILFGVNEAKRTSPCLIISGPDGLDVPMGMMENLRMREDGGGGEEAESALFIDEDTEEEGDNTQDFSVGLLSESVSGVKTRFAGYSANNGWHLYTYRSTGKLKRIDLKRPAVGGPGFTLTEDRLLWFYNVWNDILTSDIPSQENFAFKKLREIMPSWDDVVIPKDCPFHDIKVRLAYGLVIHMRKEAKAVEDAKMRERTDKYSRQSRRTTRWRASRNNIGSKQNPHVTTMGYGDEFQVEPNGSIRVQCKTTQRQEVSGWTPLHIFCERATEAGLSKFLAATLLELECNPNTFSSRISAPPTTL